MAGLFGGARRFLANQRSDGNFVDRLGLFGAQMQDIGDGGNRAGGMMAQRATAAQKEQQTAARQALHRGLFGGGQPAPQFDLGALASGDLGMTDTELAQQQPQRQGLPSLRDAAPMLMQAQQAGLDIKDYITLLDKAGPDMAVENGVAYDRRNIQAGQRLGVNLSNVNGHMIDTQDPGNANRFVPQVGEGQRLLYDSQGNPVIQNIDGYTQAIGQTEGTKAAAQAAATSHYQLETVMGPDGRPITASRQAILGGGPIYGQSDADRAYAVDSAKNDAERDNSAPQAAGRIAAANQSAKALTGAINRALEQINGLSTGLVGVATGLIPGSPAKDLRATINTIKANVGFDYLQQMRELSPTGGALGQVAVQEMEALQAVLGNLDPGQSPEQLAANLRQIGQLVQQGQQLRQEAYERQYGAQGQATSPDRAARAREILRQRGRL